MPPTLLPVVHSLAADFANLRGPPGRDGRDGRDERDCDGEILEKVLEWMANPASLGSQTDYSVTTTASPGELNRSKCSIDDYRYCFKRMLIQTWYFSLMLTFHLGTLAIS